MCLGLPPFLFSRCISNRGGDSPRCRRVPATPRRAAKDEIKAHAHATEKGMSLNAYIVSLIEADMGKLE